jgi:tetratricopeptide (TPR) repeat protein
VINCLSSKKGVSFTLNMEMEKAMLNIKKTFTHSLYFFSLLAVLTGCASKVEVDSTMNMPSKSGLALDHIAVVGFNGDKYNIKGNALSAKIKSKLMSHGYVKVHANSPYKLVGEISPSRVERNSWSEKHEGKKETWYSYHASVKQTLTLTYYVIYGQQTLNSASETFTYSKEKSSSENRSKAKDKLRTDSEVADFLIEKAADFVVKQVSPYRSLVKLNYLNGEDENIDLGIEYVKKDRLSQAFSIFEQVAQNSNSIEDQAIALHNQGLIKLMQGKHTEAYDLMTKANLIDPRNFDILDSIKEVEDYKVLSDAHKKQRGLK